MEMGLRMPGRTQLGEYSFLSFVSSQTLELAWLAQSGMFGKDRGACPGLAPEWEGLLSNPGIFLSTLPGRRVRERRKELNPKSTWLLYLP